MAKRPIFVPELSGFPYVEAVEIELDWFPGFSRSQAQKSIASLHNAAARRGITSVLEISSRSTEPLGISLSAFNLPLTTPGQQRMSVECAYQGSKVFERGGPYTDLYSATSRDAKTDERLRSSGDLIAFRFCDEHYPATPATAFYDWLYLSALRQNSDLAAQLSAYRAFSDIMFNPERSINCQARAAALYVALSHNGKIEHAVSNIDNYIRLITGGKTQFQRQMTL